MVSIVGQTVNVGTVRHESLHAGVQATSLRRSAEMASEKAGTVSRVERDSSVNAADLQNFSRLIREQRMRDLLSSIEEWRHASGEDRRVARRNARYEIALFRRAYVVPERAAYAAAVARSQRRTAA